MADFPDRTPMNRFIEFITADIDGDEETADRIAREMVRLDGLPSRFLEMRRRLRQCRTLEELHHVHRSFS